MFLESYKIKTCDEIIATYSLDVFNEVPDISIENDDLALSFDKSDVRVGDELFDAFWRLIEEWRFSEPCLHGLFDLAINSIESKKYFEKLTDNLFESNVSYEPKDDQFFENYHCYLDQGISKNSIALSASGSFFVLISNLIKKFKTRLGVKNFESENIEKFFGGYTFGTIALVCANNFRHYDDWLIGRESINPLQKKSMLVISKIFNLSLDDPSMRNSICRNVCLDILLILSQKNYENFNINFFDFIKSIILTREAK